MLRFKALLIDLSGTLHIGSTPLPGCVNAIKQLRESGIPFRFCSNTSQESSAAVCSKLGLMGFEIKDGELFTSLGACRHLIKERGFKRPYFILSQSALNEFTDMAHSDTGNHDAVIIGLAPDSLNYERLNTAFRILSGEEARLSSAMDELPPSSIPLLATHKAKYIRTSDGGLSLGPGPFVTALEMATGSEAEVIGKPTKSFFRTVIGSFEGVVDNGSLSDIAIIGDDVDADLGGGAVELGLKRILVRTGKYRDGDEHRMNFQVPDEVHDSFAAFVTSLIS